MNKEIWPASDWATSFSGVFASDGWQLWQTSWYRYGDNLWAVRGRCWMNLRWQCRDPLQGCWMSFWGGLRGWAGHEFQGSTVGIDVNIDLFMSPSTSECCPCVPETWFCGLHSLFSSQFVKNIKHPTAEILQCQACSIRWCSPYAASRFRPSVWGVITPS